MSTPEKSLSTTDKGDDVQRRFRYQAAYAVGMLLGPLVSGFLADSQGLSAVFYLSAFLCLVLAGMAYLPILSRH